MTVNARKMLNRQVVLMIGKRFCTGRYAGGVKEDSQKKLGRGVTYVHKTERTLKEKGATKAKMYEKFQEKLKF